MARSATEVDEAAFGKKDDAVARGQFDVVDLGLDVFPTILPHRRDVDFAVEVADVANDRFVLHGDHMVVRDDVQVARRRHEDVGLVLRVVHRDDAVTFHGGLQSADRVDFDHPDLSGETAQGLSTALTHVAVADDDGHLARDHDVGGALDAVDERFAATVEVVELGLRDGIVDVDGGNLEFTLGVHLIETVHPGCGFFRDPLDVSETLGVPVRVDGEVTFDGGKERGFLFVARGGDERAVGFGAGAEVQEERGVAAVVEDHVREAVVGPLEDAVGEFPVFLDRFALLCKDRDAVFDDGCRRVILGGEDVAARPANLGAEGRKGFDEDGGLNRHVQGPGNTGALEGLGFGKFLADRHEAGHFDFSDLDFLAAPGGKAKVGNDVIVLGGHRALQTKNVKRRYCRTRPSEPGEILCFRRSASRGGGNTKRTPIGKSTSAGKAVIIAVQILDFPLFLRTQGRKRRRHFVGAHALKKVNRCVGSKLGLALDATDPRARVASRSEGVRHEEVAPVHRELEVEVAVFFTVLLEEHLGGLRALYFGGGCVGLREALESHGSHEFGEERRGDRAGLAGAFLKNLFDFFGAGHKLFVAGAHGADFGVDLVGQALLGFAPTETRTQFGAERVGFFLRRESVVNHRERGAVGVLGFSGQTAVRHDAGDRFVERFAAAFEERNHVVVGLAHLAPVKPRKDFDLRAARGLRHREEGLFGGGVEEVESGGNVARHFQMLELIVSDGNFVGVEHENVGRHQNGVAEEPHRDVRIGISPRGHRLIDGRLVGVRTIHLPLAG